MFIKSECHHCGQNIEFATDDFQEDHRTEAAVFGQFVPCPSCSTQTRLYIAPPPPRTIQRRRPESFRKRLAIVGIIIGAVALCFAIGWVINKFADRVAEVAGGGVTAAYTICAVLFIIVLGLFWLMFPVVMYFQLKRSNELLERLERNTRPMAEKK